MWSMLKSKTILISEIHASLFRACLTFHFFLVETLNISRAVSLDVLSLSKEVVNHVNPMGGGNVKNLGEWVDGEDEVYS
jgi:hypothetical protein